jgi:hypothetical protein
LSAAKLHQQQWSFWFYTYILEMQSVDSIFSCDITFFNPPIFVEFFSSHAEKNPSTPFSFHNSSFTKTK